MSNLGLVEITTEWMINLQAVCTYYVGGENMNILNNDEIPAGLSMALAENLHAMEKFGKMTDAQREEIIRRSRNAESKQEMRNLVSDLEQMS